MRVASGIFARGERTHPEFFWLGIFLVTIGVGLHLPMYIEAAALNFRLAGMPMDMPMMIGMTFIFVGTVAAWYGLLPKPLQHGGAGTSVEERHELSTGAPNEAEGKLKWAHIQLLIILTVAVVIDSMKPATLGFVVPGMSSEYHLPRAIVAFLPLSGLSGLCVGSYTWGIIADRSGRRAAILLSAVMFVGTAICGAMPAFAWNVLMCFLMGLAAGGMLPIAYALLAECMPPRHRGWGLVLVGACGLTGGWFVASGFATLLEPHFGWRIMWFIGAPTGLVLIFCNNFIPESPRYLLARGRVAEARALVQRFAVSVDPGQWAASDKPEVITAHRIGSLVRGRLRAVTVTLNFTAAAWGLINFGLLLWLPSDLRARGYSVSSSNEVLFYSSLFALPTTMVVAWLYSKWSTKGTLFVLAMLTSVALMGLSLIETRAQVLQLNELLVFSALMVGVNGLIAVLLPYSAESYPVLVRGRGTGLVASTSKFGGLVAQLITTASLIPGLALAAAALAIPISVSAGMIARYGRETRNRILE
jgi:putative MFS transporter